MQPIRRPELLPHEDYAARRSEMRRRFEELVSHRRVSIGPYAILDFENHATLRARAQEAAWARKAEGADLERLVEAYNRLMPRGQELVARLWFDIDDHDRRRREIEAQTGIEATGSISFTDFVIHGVADPEAVQALREWEDESSLLHVLRFPFRRSHIEAFGHPDAVVVVGLGQDTYGHLTILPVHQRNALDGDFDPPS
ncbi:DUF3501 family protein [Telmatospirillum sp. J64-1]|uniref:DUF3501 family protein n=1 Tax=Telmatospirillum sp. J64-1 TaxID=2502183 RepID=UPI00115E4A6B|nr:DUF3501 family protein [Telmatospirillum sp. J64-1]